MFDDGYDAYRSWVLACMIDQGVLPKGTKLTAIDPLRRKRIRPMTYAPGTP